MPYTQTIVTEIRRKTNGEFESPVSIGAKQKYIGALLNSHNNNLEEQFILGVDCSEITWSDENLIKHCTRKYYSGELSEVSPLGYYIVFETDYTTTKANEFYFDEDNAMYLPDYELSKADFEALTSSEDSNYRLTLDDGSVYSFVANEDDDNYTLRVDPPIKIMKTIDLCFRTDTSDESDEQIESDILIAKKIITVKNLENNKKLTETKIVNYLTD
jgi:hypothetical protein